jgi:hypothetical protein
MSRSKAGKPTKPKAEAVQYVAVIQEPYPVVSYRVSIVPGVEGKTVHNVEETKQLLRQRQVNEAKRMLQDFLNRYQYLEEVASVVPAIKRLLKPATTKARRTAKVVTRKMLVSRVNRVLDESGNLYTPVRQGSHNLVERAKELGCIGPGEVLSPDAADKPVLLTNARRGPWRGKRK